jgi:hypothetical protein
MKRNPLLKTENAAISRLVSIVGEVLLEAGIENGSNSTVRKEYTLPARECQ